MTCHCILPRDNNRGGNAVPAQAGRNCRHMELNIKDKFGVIYADPPWLFRDWSGRPRSSAVAANKSRNRRPPYQCITTEEICTLPVERISAPDCVLFL